MKSWRDRAKARMKKLGLKQADLIEVLGVTTRGAVGHYLSGRRDLNPEQMAAFAKKLGVTLDWLQSGEGPMFPVLFIKKTKGAEQLAEPYVQKPATAAPPGVKPPAVEGAQAIFIKEIPIVGTTQAGPDAHWEELGYPPGYGDEFVDMPSNDLNAYALRVRGGSMGDRIREGEAVVCSPNSEPMVGEEVVVKTTDGQVLVKKLAYHRGGEVALDSIGDGFGRIVLQERDILFMHPVIGIVPSSRVKPRY